MVVRGRHGPEMMPFGELDEATAVIRARETPGRTTKSPVERAENVGEEYWCGEEAHRLRHVPGAKATGLIQKSPLKGLKRYSSLVPLVDFTLLARRL